MTETPETAILLCRRFGRCWEMAITTKIHASRRSICRRRRTFILSPANAIVCWVFYKMLMIFNSTYLVFYEKNCQTPLSKVNIYLYIHICISINLRFFIMGPKRYHVAKSVFNKMLMIFSSTYLVFYEKNCQTPLSKVNIYMYK